MTRSSDPARFGRVAVVMGGDSSEREVSLNSGSNVLAALRARGVDATAVDGIPALLAHIRAAAAIACSTSCTGAAAKTACCRARWKRCGVPYTGSGVLGSALTMDKVRTKRVWQALGIPTPAFAVLERGADVAAAVAAGRPAGHRQAFARGLQRRRHPRVPVEPMWPPPSNSRSATTAKCWSSR
jgi:D-alanine-D-alanine ligase